MIWLITKFNFEGTHYYENAPFDVAFLRNEHRHIFHIEVWIEQLHNDRELEYISVKRELMNHFTNNNQNYKSCEMIAEDIIDYIDEHFGFYTPVLIEGKIVSKSWNRRKSKVFVFEDNENGCCIE